MIAPAAVVMLGTLGYPIVNSFIMSFQQISQAGYWKTQFIGVTNYLHLLGEPRFQNALRVTAIYTVVAVGCEMVLGFAVALAVFAETRWSRLMRSLYIVPMVMAPVAAGLLWRYMYQPTFGVIDQALMGTGILSKPVIFLGVVGSALPSLLVVEIWQATPFVIIVFVAGLSALPQEPYDAALVDGASGWKLIRYVTLPMLRPIILIIVIIRSMDAFRAFDLVYVMTRGGPASSTETATYYTWISAFREFDLGKSSAAAYIITLVVLLMSIALISSIRSEQQ
jgi:multiple sugar transport system permease protein